MSHETWKNSLSTANKTFPSFVSLLPFVEAFGKCYTPDQYKGDCVYFKSCPALLEIYNKRPASTQDRLYLSLSQCGFRDGQPLVCCREFAAPASQPPPPPPQQPPQQVPQQPSPVAPVAPGKSLLPKPGECGIDAENRIYGGNQTFVDEYPWMALLQYSKRKKTKTGFWIIKLIIVSQQQTTEKDSTAAEFWSPVVTCWQVSQFSFKFLSNFLWVLFLFPRHSFSLCQRKRFADNVVVDRRPSWWMGHNKRRRLRWLICQWKSLQWPSRRCSNWTQDPTWTIRPASFKPTQRHCTFEIGTKRSVLNLC